jgi:hypothetical protein
MVLQCKALTVISSVNVPWPEPGMGDADYIHAFQKIVMPIAMEFAPEMVISRSLQTWRYQGLTTSLQSLQVSMLLMVMTLASVLSLQPDMRI